MERNVFKCEIFIHTEYVIHLEIIKMMDSGQIICCAVPTEDLIFYDISLHSPTNQLSSENQVNIIL